jgi:hypothetical protein
MATPISDLVLFARLSLNDNDEFQEYSDSDLENNLRFAAMALKAAWSDLDYSVVFDTTDDVYKISPDAPDWLQVLVVIKMCLMMKIFADKFSYDNNVLKVTNTSKKEDLAALRQLYEEIINERKNSCVGFSANSFDDYYTRFYLIYNEMLEGYR